MFGRIGALEVIVIFAIVLVIFGPKRIPQLGRAIGGAIQNFKRGAKSEADPGVSEGSPDQRKPGTGSKS